MAVSLLSMTVLGVVGGPPFMDNPIDCVKFIQDELIVMRLVLAIPGVAGNHQVQFPAQVDRDISPVD